MTSGSERGVRDHQTSWAHNALDRQPAAFCRRQSADPLFPFWTPRPHLQQTKMLGMCIRARVDDNKSCTVNVNKITL